MCSGEQDYGDDMMIDADAHEEKETIIDIEKNIEKNKKINKNDKNKNFNTEKTIFLSDEELEKKEKVAKLSDKLLNYSIVLSRSCGVVGGRSVTVPEGKLSW